MANKHEFSVVKKDFQAFSKAINICREDGHEYKITALTVNREPNKYQMECSEKAFFFFLKKYNQLRNDD